MPELSRFYGIVIKMYYNDHNPPHFHAEYGGDRMVVEVSTRWQLLEVDFHHGQPGS